MNTPLVTISGDQATTTSIAIAEGTGRKHKDVLALIRRYRSDLEEFGRVTFETRPFETRGGIQHQEVAITNERQSTFTLTLMRNTAVVLAFKKRLVSEFYMLAEARKANPSPAFATLPPPEAIPQNRSFRDGLALLKDLKLRAFETGDQDLLNAVVHLEAIQNHVDNVGGAALWSGPELRNSKIGGSTAPDRQAVFLRPDPTSEATSPHAISLRGRRAHVQGASLKTRRPVLSRVSNPRSISVFENGLAPVLPLAKIGATQ